MTSSLSGQSARYYVRQNGHLHQAIVSAAHNHYLLQISSVLTESLWLLTDTTCAVPNRPKTAFEEHNAIVAAIAEGKEVTAELAARQHIELSLRARLSLENY